MINGNTPAPCVPFGLAKLIQQRFRFMRIQPHGQGEMGCEVPLSVLTDDAQEHPTYGQ